MILLEREKLLSELEQKIGYSFRSRALLDRALTHRSFANERVGENCQHNEALEFLGDSVLGFVVSAWLLERFPDLSEGKLSKMKAYLVSESRLVEIAEALDLGSYILLNRGEEKTGGRQKRALLADAYEALIGVLNRKTLVRRCGSSPVALRTTSLGRCCTSMAELPSLNDSCAASCGRN